MNFTVKFMSSLLTTRNSPPNSGITITVQVAKPSLGIPLSY